MYVYMYVYDESVLSWNPYIVLHSANCRVLTLIKVCTKFLWFESVCVGSSLITETLGRIRRDLRCIVHCGLFLKVVHHGQENMLKKMAHSFDKRKTKLLIHIK